MATELTPEEPIIDKVTKEIFTLVKNNNLIIGFDMQFPIYKILPDEVKLAVSVLEKHGMKIVLTLNEKPSTPPIA